MSVRRPLRGASRAPTLATTGAARARRARARVGQTLCGKWRLDGLIGLGGMAAVYAATHKNGGRAAIKTLHPDLAELPEVYERFLEEAYVANRVGHPGAVAVRDECSSDDGTAFLVMELLDGETLDSRCQSGSKISPREVLEIADQILSVLVAAHDKGIVHRDIKPDNVLLTRDGTVKVLDFGVARVADSRRVHTTETGATVGTPAFMPPEQARGHWEKLDGRADIWSLGATMYFMLTGRLVREADTPNEELLSAMTEPIRPIRELGVVPEVLAQIVDRALAFNVKDRYPNARSMQGAVRRALAGLSNRSVRERAGSDLDLLPTRVLLRSARTLPRRHATPRRTGLGRGRALLPIAVVLFALGLLANHFDLTAALVGPEYAISEGRADGRPSLLRSDLLENAVIAVQTAELVELPPEDEQLALSNTGVAEESESADSSSATERTQ